MSISRELPLAETNFVFIYYEKNDPQYTHYDGSFCNHGVAEHIILSMQNETGEVYCALTVMEYKTLVKQLLKFDEALSVERYDRCGQEA
jgi:hypothetical protein